MRWCLEHLPAVRQAHRRGELAIGPLSSFILYRLLREAMYVVDPANASRTQLWDPGTQSWSPELLAMFDIDLNLLPGCVTSRHDYGWLDTPQGEVRLTVCSGDQSAVPFAFGPLDAQTAYINVGTGAFVQRPLRGALPDAPRLLASVVWSDGNTVIHTLEGTVNGAGSALEWFAAQEAVSLQELWSRLETPGGRRLEPPLFLNGIAGLGAPFWVSDYESRFIGGGTVEERFLAVVESIVFLVTANVEQIRRHGPPLRQICLSGGLSASRRFCRMLAALSGVPVWRSFEPEATARGLAWLVAGEPAGWLPPGGELIDSRPDEALAARYAAWRAALL